MTKLEKLTNKLKCIKWQHGPKLTINCWVHGGVAFSCVHSVGWTVNAILKIYKKFFKNILIKVKIENCIPIIITITKHCNVITILIKSYQIYLCVKWQDRLDSNNG